MAFTPASNDGVTTGTTPVTVIAAPSASTQRLCRTVTVFNNDTAARVVTLRYVSAGGTRILVKQTLQPDESLVWGGNGEHLIIDTTGKSITMILDSAPATNQLDWTSHYSDLTA